MLAHYEGAAENFPGGFSILLFGHYDKDSQNFSAPPRINQIDYHVLIQLTGNNIPRHIITSHLQRVNKSYLFRRILITRSQTLRF